MGTVAEGLARQIGVWDQMAPVYIGEVDRRFVPVVEHLIRRAELKPGQHVLDLGTGTGLGRSAGGARHHPNGHITAAAMPLLVDAGRLLTANSGRKIFVNEAGVDELRPRMEGGLLPVGKSGQTLYFEESIVRESSGGCFAGLSMEYSDRLVQRYGGSTRNVP